MKIILHDYEFLSTLLSVLPMLHSNRASENNIENFLLNRCALKIFIYAMSIMTYVMCDICVYSPADEKCELPNCLVNLLLLTWISVTHYIIWLHITTAPLQSFNNKYNKICRRIPTIYAFYNSWGFIYAYIYYKFLIWLCKILCLCPILS